VVVAVSRSTGIWLAVGAAIVVALLVVALLVVAVLYGGGSGPSTDGGY
jgi:hypothetical protein